MSLRIPMSHHELVDALEKDPAARDALHRALKQFPSPEERSAVMNKLMDPPDENGMELDSESKRDPLERIAFLLAIITMQLAVIAVMLAVSL